MASSERPRGGRRWLRRLVLLGLLAAGFLALRAWLRPEVPAGSVLLVDLAGEFPERAPDPWEAALGRAPRTFLDLMAALRGAARDDRIRAVVLRVRSLDIGWARAQDLRAAIAALRAAGKDVRACLEQEAANAMLGYFVAAAASEVSVPPSASVPLAGLRAEFLFFRDLLDRWGIDVEVARRREYKTAADPFVRRDMSPQQREMANRLLDAVLRAFVQAVAADRDLRPAAVREAIDRAPATGAELKEAGLVDRIASLEDLRAELTGERGRFLTLGDYVAAGGWQGGEAAPRALGLVYVSGPIVTGGAGVGSARRAAADDVIGALRRAGEDERVASVVVRVGSPGGSALASDLIWQAVRELKGKKPVVASLGDVAASGGYYVASAASRIVARPLSITGSIGVVLARPSVGRLLRRAGIGVEELTRGRLAHLFALTRPLGEDGRARVEAILDQVYAAFVQRVADGRGRPAREVEAVAGGRVWTGEEAVARGLVDETGGLLEALDRAKEMAGIDPAKRVPLVTYPPRRTWLDRLAEWFGARVREEVPAAVRGAWEAAASVSAVAEGGVLAQMPFAVRVR